MNNRMNKLIIEGLTFQRCMKSKIAPGNFSSVLERPNGKASKGCDFYEGSLFKKTLRLIVFGDELKMTSIKLNLLLGY